MAFFKYMDYSKFVTAIQENDEEATTRQVKVLTRVLIKFLKARYGASHHDAEDSAQNALMIVIEQIREEKVDSPDAIISYLFTTAKHEYFRWLKKDKESNYKDIPLSHSDGGDQLHRLIDEEKMNILKNCIKQLKQDYREFIEYWFNHPTHEASVVADEFDISVNNAWTRKHRVIQVLKECVQKKIKI